MEGIKSARLEQDKVRDLELKKNITAESSPKG